MLLHGLFLVAMPWVLAWSWVAIDIDTMWSSSDIFTSKLVTKHHRWWKAEVHQLRGLLQWEEQTQRLPAPALASKLSLPPTTFKPSWTAWGSKLLAFSGFLVASKNGLPTPTHLGLTFIHGWSAEGLRGGQSAKRKWNRVDLPKGRAWVAGCSPSQPGLSAFNFSFLTVLFHSFWGGWYIVITSAGWLEVRHLGPVDDWANPLKNWVVGTSDRLSFHEVEEVYDSCSVGCLRRAQTTNYSAFNVLVCSLRWTDCFVRARGRVISIFQDIEI